VINTNAAQTTQGSNTEGAMFETQARLHYRMARSEWACLSDLAFFTLMHAFSERARIAAGVTFEVWESMHYYQKNVIARRFNMGIYEGDK
jgi:hypothetical protein